MDEGTASETNPDLKDIEVKIGRKTPEGLLRCMREEASSLRGDAKLATVQEPMKETGRKSLDEKIRKLKMEMAHLRSVDVKILQQLLTVHEGIEAVKWLLEERSTLTSRCSSLTSSQYSLGDGPDTSWRGSWSSLQDPNDKLDNISIGSYLDTLADDMDEYCQSSSESVICSSTVLVSEANAGSLSGATVTAAATENRVGLRSGSVMRANLNGTAMENGAMVNGGTGTGVHNANTGTGILKPVTPFSSPQRKSEATKQDSPMCTKAPENSKCSSVFMGNTKTQGMKVNGVFEKPAIESGSPTHPGMNEKLKPYKNGKIDLDTCKMNGKMRLEYDAHWRWVQSQEDVTFL